MGRYSRSMLITFTVRVTKQHPANISFIKYYWSALYRQNRFEIKHRYPCFNSYEPIRTSDYILFCNKTRVPMFYFLYSTCYTVGRLFITRCSLNTHASILLVFYNKIALIHFSVMCCLCYQVIQLSVLSKYPWTLVLLYPLTICTKKV